MDPFNSRPPSDMIRGHESMNGNSSVPLASPQAPFASLPITMQEQAVPGHTNGALPTTQNSSQPSPSTPPSRVKHNREERMSEDGSYRPLNAPVRGPDGKFLRPRGRTPIGKKWDPESGYFVSNTKSPFGHSPQLQPSASPRAAAKNDMTNGTSPSVNGSTTMKNGSAQEQQLATKTPPLSSTNSATSTSNGTKANGTNHYTRSRGSSKTSTGRKRQNGYSSGERMTVEKNGSTKAMNECAALLAQADDEAYQSAMLQDASCILERIVFPMCFPWNHSIVPAIKNFPKDIDELPAILHAGEEEYTPFENGVFGYGGFEVGKERRSTHDEAAAAHGESFLAATRRTNDVGVIELTVIDNEGNIDESSLLRKRARQELASNETTDSSITAPDKVPNMDSSSSDSPENGVARMPTSSTSRVSPARDTDESQADSLTAAQLVFTSHEHAKSAKKQKLKASEANTQRLLVSVRCGSVSSRSSLFPPKEDTTPLLCEAVWPTRKKQSNAVGYNGEWDADRAKFLKKDTLSWTQSVSGGYESKLSFNTMTSLAAKKPREVQVGIRLNGELLSCQPGETLEDALERLPVSTAFGGASHEAHQGETSMCMVDCDLVMENFVKVNMRRNVSPHKPPRLDCVPVAVTSGSIRVVCSSPGTLRRTCITDLFRRQDHKCSVCWTTDGEIKQCFKCGVQVHASCCSHGGVLVPGSSIGMASGAPRMSWMCAVCSEGPKQRMSALSPRRRATNLPSRYQSDVLLGMGMHSQPPGYSASVNEGLKCNLCPHSGGAMSPVVGSYFTGKWSHEVCRIWTQSSAVEKEVGIPRVIANCALCGLSDGSLIKCSGSGCTVRFHPMCALIGVVKDTQAHGPVAPETPATRDARDIRLCNRFTLDIVECGDTVLPLGFCGFHNPKRDEFLYGCYPCGMGEAMRVPCVKK